MKNLSYFLGICLSLGTSVIVWITHGFSDFGEMQNPLISVFWGVVLMIMVFEPILFLGSIARAIQVLSVVGLFVHGLIVGVLVFAVWIILYRVSEKFIGWEPVFVLAGYLAANAMACTNVILLKEKKSD